MIQVQRLANMVFSRQSPEHPASFLPPPESSTQEVRVGAKKLHALTKEVIKLKEDVQKLSDKLHDELKELQQQSRAFTTHVQAQLHIELENLCKDQTQIRAVFQESEDKINKHLEIH